MSVGLEWGQEQLQDFAGQVFAGLPRVDQRETGVRYLRGLMLDGRRKSVKPMAERLGVDHQQLQQFLTSPTWDVIGVRRRLATIAVDVVAPTVWVVDDTGFARDSPASACVARQYSGTLGKVGNCLIAVSVHAATDTTSAVLDWRLFVPESWDETCVPDEAGNVTNGHARRLPGRSRTGAEQVHVLGFAEPDQHHQGLVEASQRPGPGPDAAGAAFGGEQPTDVLHEFPGDVDHGTIRKHVGPHRVGDLVVRTTYRGPPHPIPAPSDSGAFARVVPINTLALPRSAQWNISRGFSYSLLVLRNGRDVTADPDGNFISGWQLNDAQFNNVTMRGSL